MRHLLLKDLQILRRSPLVLGLLLAYALVIGLPVGFAVSRAPQKPKVAFLNEVSPGASTFSVGGRELDASDYAQRLFDAIDPLRVSSRAEAVEKVRSGEATGALIVPADVTAKLQSAVSLGGSARLPTLEVLYNADNPLKRTYVENTIESQLAKANSALSREITKVTGRYLDILLEGGRIGLLGRQLDVLGLQRAERILAAVQQSLPRDDPQRLAIDQVRRFSRQAIDNLDLSGAVLAAVSSPIRVKASAVDGPSSSLDGYAMAAALAVALMFVGVLVGAGMLALEREEHAYGRLVRGLVSRSALVVEKLLIGAICALAVGVILLVLLAIFQNVDWDRSPQIAAALALAAGGFGALGCAIGALTRDVRAASLLAFLLSLPIAAIALVPSGTVGATLFDVLEVVGALFPFKPALNALDAALNDAGPSLAGALANLGALVAAYAVLARVALRRFA
ncbi:MAG TPA: ABC transporter permease [Solirubrobacteraceae bacterium]